jgi:hypothetical protein
LTFAKRTTPATARIRSPEGRDAGISEREIVELAARIAHENYNAKSARPLRVDANNFCGMPFYTLERRHLTNS